MKSKDLFSLILEEMEFMADTPYTLSRWLSKKWEKDPDGFSYFFGEPELIKKWRINPSSGLRSLPRAKKSGSVYADMKNSIENVDILLAKNPSKEGQSGKDTRKEILLFWAQQISGKDDIFKTVEQPSEKDPNEMEKKKVLAIPNEEWDQAKSKARAEIYNRIWRDIPPDIVLQRLTIPDDNLRKMINFIKANVQDPDPEDPRPPKIGSENYEERKQQWDNFTEEVKRFIERMKESNPNQRARYLFNMIMFSKGGPKGKKEMGASERGQFKAIVPKDSNAKWVDPEVAGRKHPKIYSHPWKPYKRKKRDDDKI